MRSSLDTDRRSHGSLDCSSLTSINHLRPMVSSIYIVHAIMKQFERPVASEAALTSCSGADRRK